MKAADLSKFSRRSQPFWNLIIVQRQNKLQARSCHVASVQHTAVQAYARALQALAFELDGKIIDT